ncbi:MAG: 50S ribosomal protein L6 [Anaerolineaceae bacterium]|nr:50S ribosomal protein L6 [Anaerolineaceae bacterium]
MSRIGRLPVDIPAGVEVSISDNEVQVKGQNGVVMKRQFLPEVIIRKDGDQVIVERHDDEAFSRAIHGTTRAVIQNMVTGVSTGFKRELEVQGVGYRAEMNGKVLVINVGYSHPVEIDPPEGISFDANPKTREITVSGYDKEAVGQMAADIRKIRPPEPYKGKGIRYKGEYVRRKAGKAGKTA